MSGNKGIVTDIPVVLGTDVNEALSRYDRSEFAADYAIGNQPWLSAAKDDNRISRVTTQYQKDRVDQEATAGENSLSNWWLRSATSWHRGAGVQFYDADAGDLYRFRESANVDVWTQGELKLLPATSRVRDVLSTQPVTCGLGSWFVSDSKLFLFRASDSTITQVTALTVTPQRISTDGSSCLVAAADGIYEVSEALTVTKLYNAPTGNWTVQALGLVKDRIMVGCQIVDALPMRVFELARNPASTTTVNISTTSGDSRYEYKSTALKFVAITETTAAILVAYNVGVQAKVISFTVDTATTGLAALKEPIQVADFPIGETLNDLRTYLGTFAVAATTRGVRVGLESTNGLGFTYGPLSVVDDVQALSFDGEYVYATRSTQLLGQTGLWRIHLGTKVDDTYAYASDLSIGFDAPNGVAFIGSTGRALVTAADGVYVEHPTRRAESGYLSSGTIRFGTTEKKQPVSAALRSRQNTGALGFKVTDATGDVASFDTIPIGVALNVPLSAELLPAVEFEVTVTLSRGGVDDTGPVLEEWQLRALPAPVRSRTITLPLLCFSEERDSLGNARVSDAYERLRKLEQLEQSGGACLLQDFSTGEERICVVRAVQYEQTSPPAFTGGFGGTVTVQLQTVDVELF